MGTIRRSAALLESYAHDELIALNMSKGQCIGFNDTATCIWQLLEQPQTFEDLRASLLGIYEADPEAFEVDLEYALRRLEELGFIEIHDAGLVLSKNSGKFDRR